MIAMFLSVNGATRLNTTRQGTSMSFTLVAEKKLSIISCAALDDMAL